MVSFVSHSLNKIKPLIILTKEREVKKIPWRKENISTDNFSFTCSTYLFPWGIIKTALLSWILKSDATYSALSKNLPVTTPDPRIGLKAYPGIETHPLLLWRRQWRPTPVLLPGKSHGWRSLVGCSPWGCEESGMTERLHFHALGRKWQPTPVFLPGESQGHGSLVGCRLWGRTELDMTEAT